MINQDKTTSLQISTIDNLIVTPRPRANIYYLDFKMVTYKKKIQGKVREIFAGDYIRKDPKNNF